MLTLLLALACAPAADVDDRPTATADAVLVGWYHDDSGYPEPGSGGTGIGLCWYLVEGFALSVEYRVAASESLGVAGEDYEYPEPEVIEVSGVGAAREVVVVSGASPLQIEVLHPQAPDQPWTWTIDTGNRDGVWWVTSDTGYRGASEWPLVPGCPVDDAVEDYELNLAYWYPDIYAAE